MYKIGICDDGQNVCLYLKEKIIDYSREKGIKVEISIWYSGEELINYFKMGDKVDILFLDIELIQVSGIEVANYIRNHIGNIQMEIIYISGKTSYAQQLFKTQPLDFLIKPLKEEEIVSVLDLAFKRIPMRREIFDFQVGKEYYNVPVGDILFFCSEGRKIKIKTVQESYDFYGSLREARKKLPGNFITIHHSFVINMDYIYRYTYESVKLSDGTLLTISPANRKKVRSRILNEKKV